MTPQEKTQAIAQAQKETDRLEALLQAAYAEIGRAALAAHVGEFPEGAAKVQDLTQQLAAAKQALEAAQAAEVQEPERVCPRCGRKAASPQELYCILCGTKMVFPGQAVYCPACGHRVPENASFCTQCGKQLR